MKRYAHLMPRIAAWGNLAIAFHKAAAGKRQSPAVVRFASNLEAELNTLVRELASGDWQTGAYQRFIVRDPKLRVIHAAPFRDRVVHHALMNVVGPCLERSAIHHSYACRLGRGNLAAVQHAAACTRRHRHFLKLDVRRYFDSIQHETLRELLRRRIKDGALLATLGRVIGSFHTTADGGLPIGTLTSQYFANFYLDALDHWIMETLRCPAYARYMDDLVLWHNDAAVLADWHEHIASWLTSERGLELKGMSQPTPCRDGLPFLGYRITPRGVLLGCASRRRFVSRLRENERSHTAGELTNSALQRRTDALLAFTDVAHCRVWRSKVMQRFSAHEQGVDENSALWPARLSRAKAHDCFAVRRDFRRPTAPGASCAAAPGTTTPATAVPPTVTGTTLATTGTTRACAWPQLTRDAAAPRLTRSANCRKAGKPPPGAGRESSRSQPNVPGGDETRRMKPE